METLKKDSIIIAQAIAYANDKIKELSITLRGLREKPVITGANLEWQFRLEGSLNAYHDMLIFLQENQEE